MMAIKRSLFIAPLLWWLLTIGRLLQVEHIMQRALDLPHNAAVHPPYVNYTARGSALRRLSGKHGKRRDLVNLVQHIPKTGGTSLWTFLQKEQPDLCPDCILWNHYVGRMNFTWSVYAALDMSETELMPSPKRNVSIFTVFRDPTHHVLSQYFHCTESKWARKSRHMPQLDDWLDFWIHVRANKTIMPETTSLFLYEPFKCYRPINLQTHFTGGITSVTDLQEQYFALGITSEMKRSSCLVAARFFGKLPDTCNCSKEHRPSKVAVKREDHRVTHHGDSYNLTLSQQAKIDALTEKDRLLWQNAQLVFWQQVQQLEEEYQVELCSD